MFWKTNKEPFPDIGTRVLYIEKEDLDWMENPYQNAQIGTVTKEGNINTNNVVFLVFDFVDVLKEEIGLWAEIPEK